MEKNIVFFFYNFRSIKFDRKIKFFMSMELIYHIIEQGRNET